MKIEVTQADIHNGRVGSAHYCPVALSIKRKLNTDKVTVGIDGYIYVNDNIIAATSATAWAKWFDRVTFIPFARFFIKPFTFNLNIPAVVKRQKSKQGAN